MPSGSEDPQQGDADHIAVNPVVVALLVDPIGNRCGLLRAGWDGEAFPEALGEAFILAGNRRSARTHNTKEKQSTNSCKRLADPW